MVRRRGWRRWHRFICKVVGHDPWYSATRKNHLGLISNYIISCFRCGEVIDTYRAEVFAEGTRP